MQIDVYDLVKVLIGIICAMGTWIVLREMGRISKHAARIAVLELHSIKREELEKKVTTLTTQLHEKLSAISEERMRLHTENKEKLDEILDTTKAIHGQEVAVARIQERLRSVEEYQDILRKWKHQVVDPYLPRGFDQLEHRVRRIEGGS